MNFDGNFINGRIVRNVGNARNVKKIRNVRTAIICHTFFEPQAGADMNDDGIVNVLDVILIVDNILE